MDSSGSARAGCSAGFQIVFLVCLAGLAQFVTAAAPPADSSIQELFEQQRWEQVVAAASATSTRGAELEYFHGAALARLGRLDEARARLLAGHRFSRRDERILIELGGVAFRQRRFPEAAGWLRRANQLNPGNSYTNDFLGTIYFLQDNLEAALEYWNRIGKPRIENIRVEPRLRVDPVLLDRAFAFAPASALLLSDLLKSKARTSGLGIFPVRTFRLDGRTDGRFDLEFTARERNGWGSSKREALLSTFRGAIYQTVQPEYFNAARSAINMVSLLRWDARKRRLLGSVSSPFGHDPKYRYSLAFDVRDEQWDFNRSFHGLQPSLATLRLRRGALSGEIASFQSGKWSWSSGGEVSHRRYRDVSGGAGHGSGVLLTGLQLKQVTQVDRELWRIPERRLESSVHVSSESGRIWASPSRAFERMQITGRARWLPRMTGDDYGIHQSLRAGRIFGQAPLDELFILGLERDSDLWMRAHIGTRDGRKGNAPMGHNYFLWNGEIDKNLVDEGLLGVKLAPFLDVGRITDKSSALGSRVWLWDTGVQAKLQILGVSFRFVYGKDLRSGNNTFYVLAGR